jgi:hypothetical protein
MRCEIESLETGWYKLFLRIREDEIADLVAALQGLRGDRHFHLMSSFEDQLGVADIEISLQGKDETANMFGSYRRSKP